MWRGSGGSPFAAGAIIVKKYRLSRQIGEGAMGVVWAAVHVPTGAPVALKLVVRPEPELRRRLLREASTWASLRHENLVALLDFGETGSGDPFLVTELLEGETLAGLLARRRTLSQQEAAAIGGDVARALVALHESGLVHRDLRPANIFLHTPPGSGTPVVKVLDPGVCRDVVVPSGARTEPDAAPRSPAYASPEQACAGPSIDGRSDVWSLGVVLYEMLAGVRPFEGDEAAVLRQIVTADPAPLWHRARKVHPAIGGLVMACLRRPREERPWPVQEIALRLSPFATAAGGSLPPLAIPLGAPPEITGLEDTLNAHRSTPPAAEPSEPPVALLDADTMPLGERSAPAPWVEITRHGTLVLPPAPAVRGAPPRPAPVMSPVAARPPAPATPPATTPYPTPAELRQTVTILPPPPVLWGRTGAGSAPVDFRPGWARPGVLRVALGAAAVLAVAALTAALIAAQSDAEPSGKVPRVSPGHGVESARTPPRD